MKKRLLVIILCFIMLLNNMVVFAETEDKLDQSPVETEIETPPAQGNSSNSEEGTSEDSSSSEEGTSEDSSSSEEGTSEDSSNSEEGTSEDSSKPEEDEIFTQESMQMSMPMGITYRAHVAQIGWQEQKADGATSGTSGRSLGVEALQIGLTGKENESVGSLEYSAHVANVGWQDFVNEGQTAGTTGQSKSIEALRLRLTGTIATTHSVYYRVHVQTYGWLAWTQNGLVAGSTGWGKRIEAIEIKIVKNTEQAPDTSGESYLFPKVTYQAHVQRYGWLPTVKENQTGGTEGQGLRVEALKIQLGDLGYAGSIVYRAYVQNEGWQEWKSQGQLAGSTGKGRRIEAMQIKLTGELAQYYDVYYSVHMSNVGWRNYAVNGETTGSSDLSKAIQAVKIQLVKKGAAVPDISGKKYIQGYTDQALSFSGHISQIGDTQAAINGGLIGKEKYRLEGFTISLDQSSSYLPTGSIQYSTHVSGIGWQNWVDHGTYAGTKGQSQRVEAVMIRLTGEIADYYDIYYSTYIQGYGWLGWAKNGQAAGSTKCSYQMERLQIVLVPKEAAKPGVNANYYTEAKTRMLLGDFHTYSTNNANGTYNMQKAISAFNGIVIQPGQTISFFGVAGPCGKADGYLMAGIVGGSGYGGGICQASTTLYGAAIRAGLGIAQRRNHSISSTYVPRGLDAMVDWGTSDLKLKNNHNFPVEIRTYSFGKTIGVEIYGRDPGWYDKIEPISWPTGTHSASAARIYYKNGAEVAREPLPNSYYRN